MKKKVISQEVAIEEFVSKLKEAGVSDKTIKQMLKEINEHQEKVFKKMLEEAFKRTRKIVLGEDYE